VRLWGRRERPLVIAHRGASADAPENTLRAFRLARDHGADGVELDVMRCASGEVVVIHDDDLERLAGRAGEIRQLRWDELRTVDIGGGERIPLLTEALEEIGPLGVNVELKSHPHWARRLIDDGLPSEVGNILRHHSMIDRALVSSFDPLLLLRFRSAAPEFPTGLLFGHNQSRPLRQAWTAPLVRPMALHPEADLVDQIALEGWRRQGYAVNAWTVDEPAELRCLYALGVDAVITNRPGAALKLLDLVIPSS
jgi:glycerophosphoryl diester phosphodiesterase